MASNLKGYKNTVVILLVCIFLLILLCPALFAISETQESKLGDELGIDKTTNQTQETVIVKRPHLEYAGRGLRDPFDSIVKPDDEKVVDIDENIKVILPALTVKGVVWGGPIPQAIIDGEVVKKGDVIQEAEIIDITKEGVSVLYKKHIFKLSSPAANYTTPEE